MADEEIYTIEAGIAEVQTQDAFLNSYRAYNGPPDGIHGVPLEVIQQRPRAATPPQDTTRTTTTTTTTSSDYDSSSFLHYRPSSSRVFAIVAAFLCFCPVGLAALVYSCRAQFAKREGKFAKAAMLGKSARDLAVASIILGTSLALFGLLILIIAFLPGVKG